MPQEIVQRLHAALPGVRRWIEEYVQVHATQARTVESLGLKRLASYYPAALLQQAKTVTVARVPFPPVQQFGLPEFAPHAADAVRGHHFQRHVLLGARPQIGRCPLS